ACALLLLALGVLGKRPFAAVGFLSFLLAVAYWRRAGGRLGTWAGAAVISLLMMMELGYTTSLEYVDRNGPGNLVLPRLMGGTSDIAEFLRRQPGPIR